MAEAVCDKKKLDTGCIVSMLYADISTLLLADEHTIYKYSIPDGTTSPFIHRHLIPDMTNVDDNHFAFIDQGLFFYSTVFICNKSSGETRSSFNTDVYCSGIAYCENLYYMTYSTEQRYTDESYVKVFNEGGCQKMTIKIDVEEQNLFSRKISKIFVNFACDMYVADVDESRLLMIRFAPQGRARVLAVWDNIVANSISSSDDKLILALGGSKNEIVQIYDRGSKKTLVKQNQLQGEPTAVCADEKHIAVATKSGWWFPKVYLQFFELKEERN